jgi:hypothetical protein
MLHAFFSGLAFLVALHALTKGFNLRLTAALAAVAGLALMSKVSALPIVAVLGAVLTFELVLGESYSRRQALLYMAVFASVILLVSGWFFLRNYSLYGRLLIGNWEPDIFKKWWQFPGYRTLAYYFTFGKVFSFPYYSGFFSFLDSLYSTFWGDGFYGGMASSRGGPPWNYSYMSSVYLLGVPSTVMIVAGFAAMVRKAVAGLHMGWLLMASSLVVFFLFMVYLTLRVPFYSTAKSFYGLSLLVPLALAHAWGVDTVDSWLASRKLFLLRAALYGWLCTLVFCIYRSFFVP